MAMQYDSNFEEGNVLPSKVLNNIIDSIKENEESISLNFGKKITLKSGYYSYSGEEIINSSYKHTEKIKTNKRLEFNIEAHSCVYWKNGVCKGILYFEDMKNANDFDEIAYNFYMYNDNDVQYFNEETILYQKINTQIQEINNEFLEQLKSKKIAIIGDSISTNGAAGKDKNVMEIVIDKNDVGVNLSAYVTYWDVYDWYDNLTNLTIGGHLFTRDEIGTEVSFIPTNEDIGKEIGKPNNYYDNSTTVWWEYVRDKFNCTMIPVCWSGSSITSHEENSLKFKTSYSWHDSQIRKCGIRVSGTMNRIDPDVIIIYRGCNDMTHSPYTVLTEDYGNNVNFEYPTTDLLSNGKYGYKEGLVLLIKKLRETYKKSQIILCTMNVFKRVNYSKFPTNNGINTLPQYNNAIRDVANLMGCGLIEFDKDGITFENCYENGYITDSETIPTHPSDKGHKIMGMKAILDLQKYIVDLN